MITIFFFHHCITLFCLHIAFSTCKQVLTLYLTEQTLFIAIIIRQVNTGEITCKQKCRPVPCPVMKIACFYGPGTPRTGQATRRRLKPNGGRSWAGWCSSGKLYSYSLTQRVYIYPKSRPVDSFTCVHVLVGLTCHFVCLALVIAGSGLSNKLAKLARLACNATVKMIKTCLIGGAVLLTSQS